MIAERYTAEQLSGIAATSPLEQLLAEASRLRDEGHGAVVSYSRKVFIPLTRLCRDVCHYCTFAKAPRRDAPAYLSAAEVLAIARAGAAAGCKEALFTLGDKPELRYAQARDALAELGYATTIDYLAAMADLVFTETGLFPHVNPGVMTASDIARLRCVSISQGLMLESAAGRLCERGGAHFGSPDKQPAARLETLRLTGEARVPTTSGILIGIGETRAERLDALLALRELHEAHGHIQEIIVQNFRAKPGTHMAGADEPDIDELAWTIALARLVFGPDMNIQAPPNLTQLRFGELIDAGINDWGGISPVTPDHVNPEAAWPEIAVLAAETAARGKVLVERLASYPAYVGHASIARWHDRRFCGPLRHATDATGFARCDDWSPGSTVLPPPLRRRRRVKPKVCPRQDAPEGGNREPQFASRAGCRPHPPGGSLPQTPSLLSQKTEGPGAVLPVGGPQASAWLRQDASPARAPARISALSAIIARSATGHRLDEREIVTLFAARDRDLHLVCDAADELRRAVNGDTVSYVVTRNINYSNICGYRCRFCAFSKGKTAETLRGQPYDLGLDEIVRRTQEAWQRGATEVCLQGGIHPDYTGASYLAICRAVKQAVPDMHVHAFSPLEISQGAHTLGLSVHEFLAQLKDAGLGTLPGTAAEILDDEVRRDLCPDKLDTQGWLDVIETAHNVGLRTTATIMFGHIERLVHWARHLLRLRDLQERTGGFTELVPLPFVHMEAPMYLKGEARRGPTFREAILMHAVARLVLHPLIPNIQVSWVKLGEAGVRAALAAGVNDLGGTLMNESISRAAGTQHGEEMPPAEMERVISACGRTPRQRTTLYGDAPPEQAARSFAAAPLLPKLDPAPRKGLPSRLAGRAFPARAD